MPNTASPRAARSPRRRLGFPTVAIVVASLAPASPASSEGLVVRLMRGEAAHERAGAIAMVRALGVSASPLALASEAPDAAGGGPRGPFDLDPERTFLIEAPDAVAGEVLRLLADRTDVAWVEPLLERQAAIVSLHAAANAGGTPPNDGLPDDPLLRDTRQWGLLNAGPEGAYGGVAGADVRALEAWRMSAGAPEVLLAIADTGLDPAHPDLAAELAGGPRIVSGRNLTSADAAAWADSSGHGTPVTGVMAALTNDGPHFDSLGVAGVCGGDGGANPGCRIAPIKIARVRSATSWDIARAILHATSIGARALNLSFAGAAPSRLEREALYHAITRGCVVVAAAGNRGASAPAAPMYPAAYAVDGLCIQVGASDPNDRRAVFSSYGPGLDLVAPGVDIWTTFMTYPAANGTVLPGYVAGSGTSFAAPFVTGAIGLLAAARPELRDTDFQHLLREGASDIGAPGVDEETGWGRLDIAAALRAVPPSFGVWHDEVAATRFTPLGLDTLTVAESGPGTMDRVRLWSAARLVEARATVTLPDSFADSVRVWPRVGGTMAVRGGFHLLYFAPWAEVIDLEPRRFTLRGYLYRDETPGGSLGAAGDDPWLPLPPDQARFGFTVIGRVKGQAEEPAAALSPTLSATPNPFRGGVRLRGHGPIAVHDLAGRRVRALRADDSVGAWWDGRDEAGRPLAPGLYFVRDLRRRGPLKVLKLD